MSLRTIASVFRTALHPLAAVTSRSLDKATVVRAIRSKSLKRVLLVCLVLIVAAVSGIAEHTGAFGADQADLAVPQDSFTSHTGGHDDRVDGFSMFIISDPQYPRAPVGYLNEPDSACVEALDQVTPPLRATCYQMAFAHNENLQRAIAIDWQSLGDWDLPRITRGKSNNVRLPNGVIINGDITEVGDPSEWQTFSELWVKGSFNDTDIEKQWYLKGAVKPGPNGSLLLADVPLYVGLGNHEYENNLDTHSGGTLGRDDYGAAKESVFNMGHHIANNFKIWHQSPTHPLIWHIPCPTSHPTHRDLDALEECEYYEQDFAYADIPLEAIEFDNGKRFYRGLSPDEEAIPHEYWGDWEDDALGDEPNASLGYSWNEGDYHFVQLHNYPGYAADLPDNFGNPRNGVRVRPVFKWLRNDLAQEFGQIPARRPTGNTKYVVINMHDWSFDEADKPGEAVVNDFVFRELIKEYPVVAIFSGHVHHRWGLYTDPNPIKSSISDNVPVYYSGAALCQTGLYVDFKPRYFNVRTIGSAGAGSIVDLQPNRPHSGCNQNNGNNNLVSTHIINQKPIGNLTVPGQVFEGDIVSASHSLIDLDGDSLYELMNGSCSNTNDTTDCEIDKAKQIFPHTIIDFPAVADDAANHSIQIEVGDQCIIHNPELPEDLEPCSRAVFSTNVDIVNFPPDITSLLLPSFVQVGQQVGLSARIFDQGVLDTFNYRVDWGDGTTPTILNNELNQNVGFNHTFNQAGRRTVTLTVSDDDGDSDTASRVIDVYQHLPNTIEIIEDTVPDGPQDFSYIATWPGSNPSTFKLDDDSDGTLSNSKTSTTLAPGTYIVGQVKEANFSTTVSCVDPDGGTTTTDSTSTSSPQATIDLDAGEAIVCRFMNTELGSIKIINNTVPDGPQDFSYFYIDPGLNLTNFSLDDDSDGSLTNSKTFTGLAPGEYFAGHPKEANFSTTVSCVDPDGGTTTTDSTSALSPRATIDLDAGEDIVCTFTNSEKSHIKIITDTVQDSAQDFSYTTTGGLSLPTFTLDDDSDGALSNTQEFNDVTPGSYTVTGQGPTPGYVLTSIACDDANSTGDTSTETAAINLDQGETVTCTFTNTNRISDLAVSMATSTRGALVGSNFSQDIEVTNNGPSPSQATGVSIRLDSSSMNLISAIISTGKDCNIVSTRRLECRVGKLKPGETATITVEMEPTTQGRLPIQAEVRGERVDLIDTNNTATRVIRVSP